MINLNVIGLLLLKKTSNSVYREGQKIAEKILFFVTFYLVYVL